MKLNARRDVERGDLKGALITYEQLKKLVPNDEFVQFQIGLLSYETGNFVDAEKVLKPLVKNRKSTLEIYRYLAASQISAHHYRPAKRILLEARRRFVGSGILFYESGNYFYARDKKKKALRMWVIGINSDPSCNINFYRAAKSFMEMGCAMESIICAENFVWHEQTDAGKIVEMKKILFESYKQLFQKTLLLAKQRKQRRQLPTFLYIEESEKIYTLLTPVVSDGITTENLIMARTRFVMDWFDRGNKKMGSELFFLHDKLLREGLFDIYNQWLFGKVEDSLQNDVWNNYHVGATDSFLKYRGKILNANKSVKNYDLSNY